MRVWVVSGGTICTRTVKRYSALLGKVECDKRKVACGRDQVECDTNKVTFGRDQVACKKDKVACGKGKV